MQTNRIPPSVLLSNGDRPVISHMKQSVLSQLMLSAVHLALNLLAFLTNGEMQYPHDENHFDAKR